MLYMRVSINVGTPIAGWFMMENHSATGWFEDDLGVPHDNYGWLVVEPYPSEIWWSSSVGMMSLFFPTEWKKDVPVTNQMINVGWSTKYSWCLINRLMNGLMINSIFAFKRCFKRDLSLRCHQAWGVKDLLVSQCFRSRDMYVFPNLLRLVVYSHKLGVS
jgi:hypothetical protein